MAQCGDEATMKEWILLGLLTVPALSPAQPYSISRYKVSGGGGTSSNGQYSVSGTIGQHDAGTAMTGGNYSVTGGFWALYAVQTPGSPTLTITCSGNSATVAWPASATGFLLQTNPNPGTTAWGNYGGTVSTSNGTNSITITPPTGNLFFRLLYP